MCQSLGENGGGVATTKWQMHELWHASTGMRSMNLLWGPGGAGGMAPGPAKTEKQTVDLTASLCATDRFPLKTKYCLETETAAML